MKYLLIILTIFAIFSCKNNDPEPQGLRLYFNAGDSGYNYEDKQWKDITPNIVDLDNVETRRVSDPSINGTGDGDNKVFRSEISFINDGQIIFTDIPPGQYTLNTLHRERFFCFDGKPCGPGLREINYDINGISAIRGFELEPPGNAIRLKNTVSVNSDGKITIDFINTINRNNLNGIEILQN